MRVDLGNEILVSGKYDDQHQICRERKIDERQYGKDDLFDVVLQKMWQRIDQLMAKRDQQHHERDNESHVERRQYPARLEYPRFENVLNKAAGHRARLPRIRSQVQHAAGLPSNMGVSP